MLFFGADKKFINCSVARDCGLIPRGDHVIQVVASLDAATDHPHVEFRHLPQGALDQEGRAATKQAAEQADKAPYHFAVDGASFEIICNHFRADLLPYLVVKARSF